jgi:signal transduction histidine kinase
MGNRAAALHCPNRQTTGGYVLQVLLVAAAYYGAAKLGLQLAYPNGDVAALWPPVGVGIAALVLWGPRVWPGIVIGELLDSIGLARPFGTVIGQTVANTGEIVLAAVILRRLFGSRVGLTRIVEVVGLVGCAIGATFVGACIGAASLRLGNVIAQDQLVEVWRTWWLSDLTGALIVTPVFLTWVCARPTQIGRRDRVEALALAVALVLLAELPSQTDVPYVIFPVMIWAALRFGPIGASSALLLVASLTVWNTGHSAGPFVRDSITESVLATQLFLAAAALTSLFLAAVTAERGGAERRLLASERANRRLAAEQAALRRVATLVAADAGPAAVFERVTEEVATLLEVPSASVVRYESDVRGVLVGSWPSGNGALPIGTPLPLDDETMVARVKRRGRPERMDEYPPPGGAIFEYRRAHGLRAAVAAPVHVSGQLWGALVASATAPEALPPSAEQKLCDFADLIAQALANADAYERLAASRARIVEAGDVERRRLERNLHDGAQQRLVSLALRLRLTRNLLGADPQRAQSELSGASTELSAALEELRELARGIHPAVLTDQGLASAVTALADRSPVPVEIDAMPVGRLPAAVEAAAYYGIAEAITNCAKYAGASRVVVRVEASSDHVRVDVEDDGVGGADPDIGSGLCGIADRVEALGGRLQVVSPPGHGTRLETEIPLMTVDGDAPVSPTARPPADSFRTAGASPPRP